LRLTLIYNEKAGSGVASDELRRCIRRAGHEIVRTIRPDELGALADKQPDRALVDSELLVAAGGDGTVQRVATEMAGRQVPLAILPLGTANNIATSLGIWGPTETLVAGWSSARRSPLDLGIATGPWGARRFIESVGGGLVSNGIIVMDGEAPHEASGPDEMLEKALARFRVVLSGMTARRCRLVLDGEISEPDLLLCEVLNIRTVGPQLRLAPDADPADALFDVVVAEESHREVLDSYLHERIEGRPCALDLPMRRARRVGLGGWDRLHIDDTIYTGVDGLSVLSVSPASLEVLLPPV
jgi:diacylglycerol kinase (ATP)